MITHGFKQESNWLLSHPKLTNRLTIKEVEYARLNAPGEFTYSKNVITKLRNAYDPEQEKGGLICVQPIEHNGKLTYTAIDVIFVTNVAKNKRTSYGADHAELEKAYIQTLNNKQLPFLFHTHPTLNEGDNIMMQGMNFLYQLNTSLADQSLTRWGFRYNGVNVRLPQLLVVENSKALFIGMYGGLIAPLCFTQQKDKAVHSSMEKTLESISDWANTPERKGVLIFSALALIFLAFRYPRVVLPTAMVAGTVVPPMMYANRERHEFFGVTYLEELTIHITKLSDEEIIGYELKAIEALEELKRRREKEKNLK